MPRDNTSKYRINLEKQNINITTNEINKSRIIFESNAFQKSTKIDIKEFNRRKNNQGLLAFALVLLMFVLIYPRLENRENNNDDVNRNYSLNTNNSTNNSEKGDFSEKPNDGTIRNINGELVVENLQISKASTNYYNIFGIVENKSTDTMYNSVYMKITLFDENGKMLNAEKCLVVDYDGILPNETLQFTSYVMASGNVTNFKAEIIEEYRSSIVSTNEGSSNKSSDGTVSNLNGELVVENLQISKSSTSFYKILGTVENNSTDTMYNSVYMKITFYDENGKMVNAERCLVVDYDGIMPNETLQFTSNMMASGNVTSYETQIIEEYRSSKVSTSEGNSNKYSDGTAKNLYGELVVENLQISKSSTNYYKILGTVENKSTNTMYNSVYMKITFYDENGKMVNAERCLVVDYDGILPNETLQFTSNMMASGNVTSFTAEIIEDYRSSKVSTSEGNSNKYSDGTAKNLNGELVVENLQISKSSTNYYKILGTVENKSTDTMYNSVYMKITFYDENGKMVNAERCLVVDYDGILPNETLQFTSNMMASGNVTSFTAEILEDYSYKRVS